MPSSTVGFFKKFNCRNLSTMASNWGCLRVYGSPQAFRPKGSFSLGPLAGLLAVPLTLTLAALHSLIGQEGVPCHASAPSFFVLIVRKHERQKHPAERQLSTRLVPPLLARSPSTASPLSSPRGNCFSLEPLFHGTHSPLFVPITRPCPRPHLL